MNAAEARAAIAKKQATAAHSATTSCPDTAAASLGAHRRNAFLRGEDLVDEGMLAANVVFSRRFQPRKSGWWSTTSGIHSA